MNAQLVRLPHERLAIRVADGTLLSVPPMHRATSRTDRVRIFEYVLRRQFGLAATIAELARDSIEARDRLDARAAKATESLMSHDWETGDPGLAA